MAGRLKGANRYILDDDGEIIPAMKSANSAGLGPALTPTAAEPSMPAAPAAAVAS
jgi:hypothetical protein